MYHPYFTEKINAYEREALERCLEQRRMLLEHADQIVPRQGNRWSRSLRRIVGSRGNVIEDAEPAAPRMTPCAVAPVR